MNASVRDLKSRLPRYLRQVQQGETVVVTLRGKPSARLVPLPPLLLKEWLLRSKLYLKAIRQAFDELQKLKAA